MRKYLILILFTVIPFIKCTNAKLAKNTNGSKKSAMDKSAKPKMEQ
jgi:hypothetical protein